MRRVPAGSVGAFVVAALVTVVCSPSVFGQRVPEGTHRLVHGPATICHIRAASAADFKSKVEQSGIAPEAGTSRFDLYMSRTTGGDIVQWAIAKPIDAAYPMATCRRLFRGKHGVLMLDRQMRCDADQKACEAVYLEFRALDDKLRGALAKEAAR